MTQVDMALMGGEKIDIYLPLDGLGKAVSSNKVISLNDYLDNELKETVDTIEKTICVQVPIMTTYMAFRLTVEM